MPFKEQSKHRDKANAKIGRLRETLIALLAAIAVLSSLTPLLQGCGEDLVVGGQLIIPTVNPTSNGTATPTETPDLTGG